MAIKPIEEMIRPVSRREETKMAMSAPDPMSERNDMMESLAEKYFGKNLRDLTDDEVIQLDEMFEELISKTTTRKPEGIMQLASASSGDDIIQSAMMWAIETEFGSMEELERQLRTGESTIPGIIAAYQDAIVDMN
jgi:Mg2+/Co2+ transporter CorC